MGKIHRIEDLKKAREAGLQMLHKSGCASDYMQGESNEAVIMGWFREHFDDFIDEINRHWCDVDEYRAQSKPPAPRFLSILEHAEVQMDVAADNAEIKLPFAFDALERAERSFKAFQVLNGVSRPPKRADALLNVSILAAMAIAEGITTSLFFLSGGFVPSIGEALGLGMSMSAANVLVSAFLGGNVFGRNWNIGLGLRGNHNGSLRTKRYASRIGAVFTASVIVALLAISGIVRASGESEHLSYTFEALSAAASDYHSLLLWVIGAAFSVLAWRKGLSLFSDPVAGYSELADAVHDAQADIEVLREDALEDIEIAFEEAQDALNELEDAAQDSIDERAENYAEILAQRNALLSEVESFKIALKTKIAEENHFADQLGGVRGVGDALPNQIGDYLFSMVRAAPDFEEDDGADIQSALATTLDLLSAARSKATKKVLQACEPPLPEPDLPKFEDEIPL